MPSTVRLPVLLALTGLLCGVFGCSTTPSKPSLMANMAKGDVTVPQLRAIDYEYAAHFGQLVSMSVMDIVEASDKLEVFDQAYQWQMWAASQARGASFDPDPFAGMLELWTLAGQQRKHFTEGGGKDAFAVSRRSPSRPASGWSAISEKSPRR